MLFDHNTPVDDIWLSIKSEIRRAVVDSKHPFRFMILATSDGKSLNQRYVVLRDLDELMNLYLFSDSRTSKVQDISRRASCSVLLYHPKKRTQIRISGFGELLTNAEKEIYWKKVQGEAAKAYTSVKAPGSPIEKWGEAYHWDSTLGSKYFEVIKVHTQELEVLQLNQLEHLRIKFVKNESAWKGQVLVP